MMNTMNDQWCRLVRKCITDGIEFSPRGRKTLELQHATVYIDMNYPVLTNARRAPSYRLMVGEAAWILSGSDKLADILPYNKHMEAFSDDKIILAGAYGPRIASQLPYVVGKLIEDRDTRQATLTIWTPNPAPTKDYPCTVAMDFKIRDNQLNCHVFMRSSDIWLGLPYDVFVFSAVSWAVLSQLNGAGREVSPGTLCLTAASSHLYEDNWLDAATAAYTVGRDLVPPVPVMFWDGTRSTLTLLEQLRDTKIGDDTRWWEQMKRIAPNHP